MAGHGSGSEHNFTGIKKYFNAYTIIGRRNCVLATYASVGAIVLYFVYGRKKPAPVTEN